MHTIQKYINKLDIFQQKHKLFAFPYAVIKKSGEDKVGQQAALLTYYSFLAIFPLLLVLTTLTNELLGGNPDLEETIVNGLTDYFPLLGDQLSTHVYSLQRNGLALFGGLIFAFYGARGVADVFQHGVQNIWNIPDSERDGFPKSLFKSLSIIGVGGIGFIIASVSAGLANAAGHGLAFRSLSVLVNVFVLYWLFTFLLNYSLPERVKKQDTQLGAVTAAAGLVILQYLGVFILARELKNLDALYSYFAIALGMMFWLYLQAQMIYFAAQVSVVSSQKLWPRSFNSKKPKT